MNEASFICNNNMYNVITKPDKNTKHLPDILARRLIIYVGKYPYMLSRTITMKLHFMQNNNTSPA